MSTIQIERRSVRNIRSILNAISRDRHAPQDVQANCTYWAGVVSRRMDRRDAQTAAWILLAASDVQTLRADTRHNACYWGTYLLSKP